MNAAAPGLMDREIAEAADAVARQASLAEPVAALAARLRKAPPRVAVTCARGSSAHAATFGKHLIERRFGIPVAAAAPNIATIYRRRLALADQLFIAISQSGRSDDLVEQTRSARASGAITAAVLNVTDSPVAAASEIILPMQAGPERSVAATKTFIASVAVLLRLVAAWDDDATLQAALAALPDALRHAARKDRTSDLQHLATANSLIAIGRGPTLAIAREAALKLKETCNLHAEAFSGAEFLHGPVALVESDFPVLMFMPRDEAEPGLRQLCEDLRRKGASVILFEADGTGHPETDALCLIQSFYALLPSLARQRGTDIDRPRHLQKVTRTR